MRRKQLEQAVAIIVLLGAAPLAAGQPPVGVSPGAAARFSILPDPCPTFSWGAVAGAEGYELVVFEVDPARTAASPTALADPFQVVDDSPPALLRKIPAAALSWTPAADECLRRGGRYAWLVRAAADGRPTDWSEPRWFELAAPPGVEEVEEALETLRAFLREQRRSGGESVARDGFRRTLAAVVESMTAGGERGSVAAPGTRAAPAGFALGLSAEPTDAGSGSIGVYGASDSVVTGSAGLFGEAVGASGAVDGVQGVSMSVEGSGVRGLALAATGVTAGVVGGVESPAGFGGFFYNFGDNGVGAWALGGGGAAADLVLSGNLFPLGLGFDDGRLRSDPRYASSDLFFTSNDDFIVELDADGEGEDSDFSIVDKDGMTVFNVDRTGTTLIEGDLFLIGDPQGGLVSIEEVEQLIDAHRATEHPKLVFVTSTTYQGNLGGTAGADQKCQARAAAAGLLGTFKAWISGDSLSEEARDRLVQADVNFRRLDGVKVADDWDDLTDGTLDAPINVNEFGNSTSGTVYTNTDADGSRHEIDRECGPSVGAGADWNSNGNLDSGAYGMVGNTGSTWTFSSNNNCSIFRRLYCFEQ